MEEEEQEATHGINLFPCPRSLLPLCTMYPVRTDGEREEGWDRVRVCSD